MIIEIINTFLIKLKRIVLTEMKLFTIKLIITIR